MKPMTFLSACAIAAMALAGCATEYQQEGMTGGYKHTMITPSRALVSFSGNGYTSEERVAQYVMLAAAELTYDKGYGHFAIVGDEDAGRRDSGFATSCTMYGCYGNAYAIEKPKDILTIEMFAGPKPADAPSNVFNAATVINTIRPEIGTGN
jgi:hypothetical protein